MYGRSRLPEQRRPCCDIASCRAGRWYRTGRNCAGGSRLTLRPDRSRSLAALAGGRTTTARIRTLSDLELRLAALPNETPAPIWLAGARKHLAMSGPCSTFTSRYAGARQVRRDQSLRSLRSLRYSAVLMGRMLGSSRLACAGRPHRLACCAKSGIRPLLSSPLHIVLSANYFESPHARRPMNDPETHESLNRWAAHATRLPEGRLLRSWSRT